MSINTNLNALRAWCPESWRLSSLGREPSDREAMANGQRRWRDRRHRRPDAPLRPAQARGPAGPAGEGGGGIVPEEWKPSKRAGDGHRLQLGAYFLLIEEEFEARPPHGCVVLGDGTRVLLDDTAELRAKVLETAEAIRRRRRAFREEIPVRHPAAKRRACGRRTNCRQGIS